MGKSHKLLYDGAGAMNLVREEKLSFGPAHVVTEGRKKINKRVATSRLPQGSNKSHFEVITLPTPTSETPIYIYRVKAWSVSCHLFVAS